MLHDSGYILIKSKRKVELNIECGWNLEHGTKELRGNVKLGNSITVDINDMI